MLDITTLTVSGMKKEFTIQVESIRRVVCLGVLFVCLLVGFVWVFSFILVFGGFFWFGLVWVLFLIIFYFISHMMRYLKIT